MPAVGKIDLKANKNVSANAETTLSDLFPYPERNKEFTLDTDVTCDKTKLKVTIAKLGTLDITADGTNKKGEKANLWMLSHAADFRKKIKASQAIKKGDTLTVTIETA